VDGSYKGKLKDEPKDMYDLLNTNIQEKIRGFFLVNKDHNIKNLSEVGIIVN
jgi:hypothetical protein